MASTVTHLVKVIDEGPPSTLGLYYQHMSDELALLHDATGFDAQYDILARIAAETVVAMEVIDLERRAL